MKYLLTGYGLHYTRILEVVKGGKVAIIATPIADIDVKEA